MIAGNLFEFTASVDPWLPHALTVADWRAQHGPDYRAVFAWRIVMLERFAADPVALQGALAYYAQPAHCAEFIMHWVDTYDPRRATMKWLPFVFFERQAEFIEFLVALNTEQANGLIEKARDMGLTWLCVGYSVWAWLFVPGVAIGWGSRKQESVDKIGDPSSIFEKIRLAIRRLPPMFRPEGLDTARHLTFMKCINPATGAVISGEVGDNIGRGGRTTLYFKDESAHYEHPEAIEAALADNTNVQIDISSVNGVGNPFYNKRHAGVEWYPGHTIEHGKSNVFVADWRDHPEKTEAWYQIRKAAAIAQGLEHLLVAQELDRNYAASVTGTIIQLEWIKAAIDADQKLAHWRDEKNQPIKFTSGGDMAALDVADSEEGDRNAWVHRHGIVLDVAEEWGERDVGVTTRRAINLMRPYMPGIECQYDSVGMGSAVKSEYNRLTIDPDPAIGKPLISTDAIRMSPWNAGASVIDPYYRVIPNDLQSPMNEEFFANLKAQAWWALARRFYRTWQAVTQGIVFPVSELIVIRGSLGQIRQIEKELVQPTMSRNTGHLKMLVDKKPNGTKSPNIADAIVMCYFPISNSGPVSIIGTFG